jgi:hypothetical protein
MLHIQQKLKSFKPISLTQMDGVALMERVDEKYTVSINDITDILEKTIGQYYCLEIDGKRSFSYQTEYFDTPNNILFRNHQNGKLNRYKIRFRDYIESKKTFLEVKFKSNKGVTKKTRISIPFKEEQSPYLTKNLEIKLENNFERVTLVNLISKERVTIDYNLKFKSDLLGTKSEISNLGIIEIKREKGNKKSQLLSILKDKRIRPTSFSKYAIGSCLLNSNLKYNRFKSKLLLINKTA